MPSLFSYDIFTEFFKLFEDISLEPSFISKPCFIKSFNESFAISASAIGKKLSIASITVTLEPSLDHTLPNSRPITPAPITPTVLGTLLNSKAPVLSTIFLLSKIADGICIGDDPVAIIMFLVSTNSILPSVFVISTIELARTFPLP